MIVMTMMIIGAMEKSDNEPSSPSQSQPHQQEAVSRLNHAQEDERNRGSSRTPAHFHPGTAAAYAPHPVNCACAACAPLDAQSPSVALQWFSPNQLGLLPPLEGLPADPVLAVLEESWTVATQIVDTCDELAAISSLPLHTDKIAHAIRCKERLQDLILSFQKSLSKSLPPEIVSQHLNIFEKAGATRALASLYCSFPNEDIASFSSINWAAGGINMLFTGWKEGLDPVLPETVLAPTIPILFQLYKHIGDTLPHNSRYRTFLAYLMDNYGHAYFDLKDASVTISAVAHIVHQISFSIHHIWQNNWVQGSEQSISSSSFTCDSMNFICYLFPLCKALHGSEVASTSTVEIGSEGWLKTIFEKHLEDVRCYLHCSSIVETMGKYQLLAFFNVIRALYIIAGVYQVGIIALRDLFLSQGSLLNTLIGKLQLREGDYTWFIEFKSYLQPDIRKELALSLLSFTKHNICDSTHLIHVHRLTLLSDSFEILTSLEAEELQRGISVLFARERATGPAVLCEWFSLVCREIFNPANGLFKSCPNDARRVFPNPNSQVDPEHLKYFGFCGRVIALALMHNIEIDTVLDLSFFKQIAKLPVSWEDIQDADPELYKNLGKLLEMDSEYIDSDALALTFTAEVEQLDGWRTVELCAGGEEIKVNSRNRLDYVNMTVRNSFVNPIVEQVEYFCQGFSDLLQCGSCYDFFQILQLDELNLMLYGKDRDIDAEDWKSHTEYQGYEERDKHIEWFWKIVSEMSMEQRGKLLQFSTSLSHLPGGGFADLPLRFVICKSFSDSNHFPSAHTCFYRLFLPLYPTFEIMQDRLHFVIEDDFCYGFALF